MGRIGSMGGTGGMGEAEAERRSEAEHALQAENSGTISFLADGGGAQPGANARRRRSVRLPNVEAVRASVQYSEEDEEKEAEMD